MLSILYIMAFSVRRMTVLDMHGFTGGRVRRKVVTAEFFAALALGTALGIVFATRHAPLPWTVELLGDGLNYVPLAIHAVRFLPGDAVERELEGVDSRRQLRPYGLANLLLFVPGLIFVLGFMPGEWHRVPSKVSLLERSGAAKDVSMP